MNEEMQTTPPAKSNMGVVIVVLVLLGLGGLVLAKNMMAKPEMKKTDSMVMEDSKTSASIEPQGMIPTPTSETTTDTSMQGETMMISDSSAAEVIKMDMGAFYYKPAMIKVKKGQKVRIELTSKDMMHDFNIDALKVKSPIVKAGETATVEFVADQVGTFEYYCSVGQHRKNGQVGTLIVEE